MAMPLSLKIVMGVLGLAVLVALGSVWTEHRAQHRADEITQEAQRVAEQNQQQAEDRARQKHADLMASLERQRESRYNNYQQISDQARQYRVAEAARKQRQQQEAQRVAASYLLASNQQCLEGVVINRQGSSFAKAVGRDGHDIACNRKKATQPLR